VFINTGARLLQRSLDGGRETIGAIHAG